MCLCVGGVISQCVCVRLCLYVRRSVGGSLPVWVEQLACVCLTERQIHGFRRIKISLWFLKKTVKKVMTATRLHYLPNTTSQQASKGTRPSNPSMACQPSVNKNHTVTFTSCIFNNIYFPKIMEAHFWCKSGFLAPNGVTIPSGWNFATFIAFHNLNKTCHL